MFHQEAHAGLVVEVSGMEQALARVIRGMDVELCSPPPKRVPQTNTIPEHNWTAAFKVNLLLQYYRHSSTQEAFCHL